MLKERGAREVVPRLAAWVKELDASDPNSEHHRLEALWTYQAVDVAEPALLASLLDSKDAAGPGGRHAGRAVLEDAANRSAVASGGARERHKPARPARSRPEPCPARQPEFGGSCVKRGRSPHRSVPRIWPVADGPPACPVLAARGPGRSVRFRRPSRAPCFRTPRCRLARDRQAALGPVQGGQCPRGPDRECPDRDRATGGARRPGGRP